MAIIRLEALKKLGELIVCDIPELSGRICVGQADPSHTLEYPSLVIDPQRWTYIPDQALTHHEPTPDAVVVNVGRHETQVEIILSAKTQYERYRLEQAILDVFLKTPMHPGVLFAPVTACEALGDFTAAWELDSDEWRDELAFDQSFQSRILALGIIPALATRRGVYTIEQLQLGLEITETPESPSATFGPPAVEVVLINEDGTISAVP